MIPTISIFGFLTATLAGAAFMHGSMDGVVAGGCAYLSAFCIAAIAVRTLGKTKHDPCPHYMDAK